LLRFFTRSRAPRSSENCDAAFFFQLKGARGVARLTPRENPNEQARRAAARALPLRTAKRAANFFDREDHYILRRDTYMNSTNTLRLAALATLVFGSALAARPAAAQTARDRQVYSDSDASPRSRRPARDDESPTEILRGARTIFVAPNAHVDAEYLEYKLDKLPEFGEWRLSIVKDKEKADLVIEINKTALNYVFTVVEPASAKVVAKGKVVAINGLVAAEDISHEIVRRMKEKRALPE
jgi:hypothetical protein